VGPKGFTLVELVMVMAVIVLTVAMVVPRLPDFAGLAFDRSARRSALFIQEVRRRAVDKQRWYRTEISFDPAVLTASYYGPENLYVTDEELPPFELPAAVLLQDVETAAAGKSLGGPAFLHFSPRGVVEPSAIHLSDGKGHSVTLLPELVTGGVEVVPGYSELAREVPRP
jgi:general secretion pathway protein H